MREAVAFDSIPGWFHRLWRDHGLSGIQFYEDNIHLVAARNDKLLDDIRTAEDNQFAADFITE